VGDSYQGQVVPGREHDPKLLGEISTTPFNSPIILTMDVEHILMGAGNDSDRVKQEQVLTIEECFDGSRLFVKQVLEPT
jgi:hypothetical protein